MFNQKRRRLFIDIEVQVALLTRVVMYWFTFATAMMLVQSCWIVLVDRPSSSLVMFQRALEQLGPALLATLLLMPAIMLDSLRMSNRFVGPVYRLRKSMRDLSLDQDVKPIHLRKGDFWVELVDDFNRVAENQRAARAKESEVEEPVAS